MKYCVYKHTFPDGKVYIGQTRSGETERRWQNGNGYCGQKVYEAIKRFGWDNIRHEIIADYLTQEEADQLEIQTIKECDATKNGYNVSLGGRSIKDPHYLRKESGLLMHTLKYCGFVDFEDYLRKQGIKRDLKELDFEAMNTAVTVIDRDAYSAVTGKSFSRNYPEIPINRSRAAVMLHFAIKLFCLMLKYDQIAGEAGELSTEEQNRLFSECDGIVDQARSIFSIYAH